MAAAATTSRTGPAVRGARRASRVEVREGLVAAVRKSATAENREGVTDLQRARLISALVEVVRERGVGEVTVAHVVTRSGVSRRTLYELFASREECFLEALEEGARRASRRVLPAFQAAGSWRQRARAGLAEILAFLEDEPGLGALCLVDALGAGPRALERRALLVRALVDAVDGGRSEARPGSTPTRLTAEGVVGAVLGVLHARLAASDPDGHPALDPSGHAMPDPSRQAVPDRGGGAQGDPDGASSQGQRDGAVPLMDLLSPLMGIVVLPYLGQAAAKREVSLPTPIRVRAVRSRRDPLRELDMRLTYRTVRALLAIAAQPGASNREVADVAGVSDQGQISKLLARLEHLGLIHNQSDGHARGEPNSWALTPKGQEIAHTVREQGAAPGGSGAGGTAPSRSRQRR